MGLREGENWPLDAMIKDNCQGVVASRCLVSGRPHKMENKVSAAALCCSTLLGFSSSVQPGEAGIRLIPVSR